ncbi:C4-dicarboxylate transporter/malic acid transporter [Colletotrichum lupini]|uniref:C4-dicarboxylate transporter/malic acid transporter n=1 Tax=Colletotrichum lupini TaxID=145971 RepID=A0A9Q8SCR0_9PEZI|nr:C4-dicarboxylate transporter/malic acid transporter [Colletotrichum lupini]UQC74620.1 C4-dicarboxylate transporter/malic acid transporter [Colletotrichum lupini]
MTLIDYLLTSLGADEPTIQASLLLHCGYGVHVRIYSSEGNGGIAVLESELKSGYQSLGLDVWPEIPVRSDRCRWPVTRILPISVSNELFKFYQDSQLLAATTFQAGLCFVIHFATLERAERKGKSGGKKSLTTAQLRLCISAAFTPVVLCHPRQGHIRHHFTLHNLSLGFALLTKPGHLPFQPIVIPTVERVIVGVHLQRDCHHKHHNNSTALAAAHTTTRRHLTISTHTSRPRPGLILPSRLSQRHTFTQPALRGTAFKDARPLLSMPLFDLGSLFLDHVVFITNLVYMNIALSNAEPSLLFPLYVVLGFSHRKMAPTHEMVANCGYQTPDEHSNRPSYFATPNESPLASLPLPRSPLRRPPFVPRSSHGPAFETEDSTAMPAAERQAESNESSPNNAKPTLEKHFSFGKVGIRDRIACHTWTWFTMTMATGGMANVIHSLPYQAAWLNGIAVAFFLLNVILFIINCALASIRFKSRPGALTHSFTDQTESLFIPSAVVSFAIISINICQFGVPHVGPWLLRIMQILFWFYIALSVLASATIYLILWSTLIFPIHTMTPTWVFPAYPLLLTAPFASNLIQAAVQTNQQVVTLNRTAIALCAVATQGAGCLIAFMISAAFIYRLMTQKLPRDFQRPGVFISIGPFAFTVGGLDKILPSNFLGTDLAVPIIKVMSVLIGLWLWGLSMWFFIVSVGSLWKYVRPESKMPFQMTWWSFVFPNTALVTATTALGKALQNNGLQIFGCVFAACLIVIWFIVFVTMIRCLYKRELLWPKDTQ